MSCCSFLFPVLELVILVQVYAKHGWVLLEKLAHIIGNYHYISLIVFTYANIQDKAAFSIKAFCSRLYSWTIAYIKLFPLQPFLNKCTRILQNRFHDLESVSQFERALTHRLITCIITVG